MAVIVAYPDRIAHSGTESENMSNQMNSLKDVGPRAIKSIYVFILHTMQIGGIESLAVRMANSLVAIGEKVYFFCPDGPMISSLDSKISIICCQNSAAFKNNLRNAPWPQHQFHANIWLSLPNLIIKTLWFQNYIWKKFQATSSSVSGIFHPSQIKKASPLSALFYKTLLLKYLLPNGSVYFMNEGCKLFTQKTWGSTFKDWPVHNLYIDQKPSHPNWTPSNSRKLRIVSVGRLVSFKTYNYEIVQIIRNLKQRGICATWDIYGDGPDKNILEDSVVAAGLNSAVRFNGSIPYSELAATIRKYDLFVGMGTAALEAAQIGMPVILAIESTKGESYGFLFEAPSDSLGEKIIGMKTTPIIDVLAKFSEFRATERIRIGDSCKIDTSNRSKGERAPFSTMFKGGLHYPPHQFNFRSTILRAQAFSHLLRCNRIK